MKIAKFKGGNESGNPTFSCRGRQFKLLGLVLCWIAIISLPGCCWSEKIPAAETETSRSATAGAGNQDYDQSQNQQHQHQHQPQWERDSSSSSYSAQAGTGVSSMASAGERRLSQSPVPGMEVAGSSTSMQSSYSVPAPAQSPSPSYGGGGGGGWGWGSQSQPTVYYYQQMPNNPPPMMTKPPAMMESDPLMLILMGFLGLISGIDLSSLSSMSGLLGLSGLSGLAGLKGLKGLVALKAAKGLLALNALPLLPLLLPLLLPILLPLTLIGLLPLLLLLFIPIPVATIGRRRSISSGNNGFGFDFYPPNNPDLDPEFMSRFNDEAYDEVNSKSPFLQNGGENGSERIYSSNNKTSLAISPQPKEKRSFKSRGNNNGANPQPQHLTAIVAKEYARLFTSVLSTSDCVERISCELSRVARDYKIYSNTFSKMMTYKLSLVSSTLVEKINGATKSGMKCKRFKCMGWLF